ncbi:MAG: peptidase M48, partial [Gemmatimonadales bacterium]
INGLRAVTTDFRAVTSQATLTGSAAFVAYDGNVYQILGYGIASTWRSNRDDVQRSFGSFGELRDREALGRQPLRLDIVTLPRAMTVQQFAESYPSEVSVDRLALLNQLEVGATIRAGTKMKRVVQ